MGASSSKTEEDKALQLCRERKKFVRQALDGRCSLAAAHVLYIQSLKCTGAALRKFVEPEAGIESFLYNSTSATPEPLNFTEKSFSQFSFSSPSVSQRVDLTADHVSPSPSPPTFHRYHVSHMKFRGGFSKKVEEKPPVAVTGTITSSSTPQNIPPNSCERAEAPPSPPQPDDYPSPVHHDNSPWDYFGLFHPIDNHLTSDQQRQMSQRFADDDHFDQTGDNEVMPEVEENAEEITSSHGKEEESEDSEDEFDDPSSDTLVRSFENLNRLASHGGASASPTTLRTESDTSETETEPLNKEQNSPQVSPFRAKASNETVQNDSKTTADKEDGTPTPPRDDGIEHKVAPKDFFLSMRDVENLFTKASDSGREVPRMLEANKLYFRPVLPGKETDGSITITLLKACFSCGKEPSQMPEEPAETLVKYLTWHRNMSFRSSSSRNLLGVNSNEDGNGLSGHLFDNTCMISGSHASTLDRLYAWERKLYDEVKASQIVRRKYDLKCKHLREQESRDESTVKIDKTRAVIKDLYSRIRVSIHRINSISKRIEELRDKELQPQLEELIEGLRRMWEVMSECHKLQLHIITIAYGGNTNMKKIPVNSDLQRDAADYLNEQLSTWASSFTKWIGALKSYVQAINVWLHKCVSLPQQDSTSRRRRKWGRNQVPTLRKSGPPIYTTCGVWLELLEEVPVKEVCETAKGLAAETSRFLPRVATGKKTGARGKSGEYLSGPENIESDDGFELDWNSTGFNHFRSRLVIFLNQLSNFSESSVKLYVDLQKSIQESKTYYERLMAQPL